MLTTSQLVQRNEFMTELFHVRTEAFYPAMSTFPNHWVVRESLEGVKFAGSQEAGNRAKRNGNAGFGRDGYGAISGLGNGKKSFSGCSRRHLILFIDS
jgi:hypothetical protein